MKNQPDTWIRYQVSFAYESPTKVESWAKCLPTGISDATLLREVNSEKCSHRKSRCSRSIHILCKHFMVSIEWTTNTPPLLRQTWVRSWTLSSNFSILFAITVIDLLWIQRHIKFPKQATSTGKLLYKAFFFWSAINIWKTLLHLVDTIDENIT